MNPPIIACFLFANVLTFVGFGPVLPAALFLATALALCDALDRVPRRQGSGARRGRGCPPGIAEDDLLLAVWVLNKMRNLLDPLRVGKGGRKTPPG